MVHCRGSCISPKIKRSRWKWRQFLPTLPSRPQLRSIQQSASVSQFVPWTFVEGLQQARNARSARCVECLSAGVYEFSSPAVKPGHRFNISSLTLEFEYFVGGYPKDGNVCLGIDIGGIVVHSRTGHEFNFGGALNTTDLPLRLRLALLSPFTCREAGQSR